MLKSYRTFHILLACTLCFLLAPAHSPARKQADFWVVGDGNVISFNSGSPVLQAPRPFRTFESFSSWSDPATGALMFYTNGDTVWNADHIPIQGATGLFGKESSSQGSLILPLPATDSVYYLFNTTDTESHQERPWRDGLYYSVLDLRLNGKRGAIPDDRKNIRLLEKNTEGLAATYHCDAKGYWIVNHQMATQNFYAFRLSATGLNEEAVISAVGTRLDTGRVAQTITTLEFSPRGDKLAMATYGFVELYDFDRTSGRISNPRTVVREGGNILYFGLSFSRDGSRLYVNRNYEQLWQYDVNQADISQSGVFIADANQRHSAFGDIQLGPDGKLYIARLRVDKMDIITYPNRPGTACAYQQYAFDLKGRECFLGLPTFVDAWLSGLDFTPDCPDAVHAAFLYESGAHCAGSLIQFNNESLGEVLEQYWSFAGGEPAVSNEQNPQVFFAEAGTYTVRLTVVGEFNEDTFEREVVILPPPPAEAGADLRMCSGESDRRLAGSGGLEYEWYPRAGLSDHTVADPLVSPSASTMYYLSVRDENGCEARDSVFVEVLPLPALIPAPDAATCRGSSVQIGRMDDPVYSYTWEPAQGLDNPQAARPHATPESDTEYYLTVRSTAGCAVYDTVTVVVRESSLPHALAAEMFVCRGESARIELEAEPGWSFHWEPATELDDASTRNPVVFPTEDREYRVIMNNGQCSDTAYTTIKVAASPVLETGGDIHICRGESAVLRAESDNFLHWRTESGLVLATSAEHRVQPEQNTRYIAEAANDYGCHTIAVVQVLVAERRPVGLHVATLDIKAKPGDRVSVPFSLRYENGGEATDSIHCVLGYDASGLRYVPNSARGLENAADWHFDIEELALHNQLVVSGGGATALNSGPLFTLDFEVFMSVRDTMFAPLSAGSFKPGANSCLQAIPALNEDGGIGLSDFCLANTRTIGLGLHNYSLGQAQPNPARGGVRIEYGIGIAGPVKIVLFDALGAVVRIAVNAYHAAGSYTVELTGLNAGAYYYRIESGSFLAVERLLIQP